MKLLRSVSMCVIRYYTSDEAIRLKCTRTTVGTENQSGAAVKVICSKICYKFIGRTIVLYVYVQYVFDVHSVQLDLWRNGNNVVERVEPHDDVTQCAGKITN